MRVMLSSNGVEDSAAQLCFAYSKNGPDAKWAGSQIIMVGVFAFREHLDFLLEGYLEKGDSFYGNLTHKALIVTYDGTWLVNDVIGYKHPGLAVAPLWTQENIDAGRRHPFNMPGLNPLKSEEHAVLLNCILAANACHSVSAFFSYFEPVIKEKVSFSEKMKRMLKCQSRT